MSRVISSEIVQAYCLKHKNITEHIEYTKQDGTKKYVCRLCKTDAPYQFPVYGKRPASQFKQPERETPVFGRVVA